MGDVDVFSAQIKSWTVFDSCCPSTTENEELQITPDDPNNHATTIVYVSQRRFLL